MTLSSIFQVLCHLHHTRFHFPVVCRLLLRFSRLSWKGKKALKSTVCCPHWPCTGAQAHFVNMKECWGGVGVGGNQADRDSPAQTCEITELHAHVLRQVYYLARITIIFSLEHQHLTLNSHLVLLKANSLITETLAAHLFCLVFYQGCTAEHKQYGAQILHTDDIRPVFVTSKPEEFSLDCSDFYSFKHQFQENCMIL